MGIAAHVDTLLLYDGNVINVKKKYFVHLYLFICNDFVSCSISSGIFVISKIESIARTDLCIFYYVGVNKERMK